MRFIDQSEDLVMAACLNSPKLERVWPVCPEAKMVRRGPLTVAAWRCLGAITNAESQAPPSRVGIQRDRLAAATPLSCTQRMETYSPKSPSTMFSAALFGMNGPKLETVQTSCSE